MMDEHISKTLNAIKIEIRIKIIAKIFCYLTLFLSVIFFAFQIFFNQSQNIKLIKNLKNNSKNYLIEKVMINPKINFQKEENEIYLITAKKS